MDLQRAGRFPIFSEPIPSMLTSRANMKFVLLLLALILPLNLRAAKETARNIPTDKSEPKELQDPLTVRALTRLEERLNIKFNIPFPATFDIDVYMKQPLALWEIGGSKVSVTRPIINPYDEPRTVEWMIGPADPKKLPFADSVHVRIDLDDHGDFTRLNLIADWTSNKGDEHLLDRGESESSAEFFERARLTYQSMAKKAKDPVAAILYLTALEKMASTIQTLHKVERR